MFYVLGDIHGSASEFISRIIMIERENGKLTPDDTILCVGDVALEYGWARGTMLRALMRKLPCEVVVMRGNHDNRYVRELGDADGSMRVDWHGITGLTSDEYGNVVFLPDEGGMFTINGKNCLVIPGAYSVDVDYRLATGLPYESEELLTTAEMDNIIDIAEKNKIDFVFSHTCPLGWERYIDDLFLDGLDQSRIDKSMERFLDVVLENVEDTCRGWYFGHFHDDRDVGDIGHMLYRDYEVVPELSSPIQG